MSTRHDHGHGHEHHGQDGTAPAGRTTRQREAIRRAIAAAGRPLLPDEVLMLAQAEVQGLGIATVYRNLRLLAEAGEILVVALPGEAPRYESAHHGHHHHFHCRQCDRVFDMHLCPGDFHTLAAPGFRVEAHELTLYGLCADCAAAQGDGVGQPHAKGAKDSRRTRKS